MGWAKWPQPRQWDTEGERANNEEYYINVSPLSQEEYYINVSPLNQQLNQITIKTVGGDKNDFKIYIADDDSIYVKPNDIFDDYGLPDGNYKLQIDFLRQVSPDDSDDLELDYIILK